MADVFLSYKRSERTAVELIADRLRKLDLTVWFDAHLNSGEFFSAEIDREARAAKVILVCWSPEAKVSKWVEAEALIGLEQDKLAACYISGPEFQPRTPFNAIHTEDLRTWISAPSNADPAWRKLLHRIGNLCSRPDIEAWGAFGDPPKVKDLQTWISSHGESVLFFDVHQTLELREAEEAEQAQQEKAARQRRLEEEKRREIEAAEEQRSREQFAAETKERERRAQGPIPTLIGTLLSVPIFFSAYATAASIAFVALIVWQWLMASRGSGLTNGAELIASLASGYAGAVGGRMAIDKFLKAWNGWPIFLLLVFVFSLTFFVLTTHSKTAGNWWFIALLAGHSAVSLYFSSEYILRKKTL
jgi:hypothetical protein